MNNMKRGILALALALSAITTTLAEDANNAYADDAVNNGYGDDAVNNNGYAYNLYGDDAVTDDALDVTETEICGDSIIQVQDVAITCDSSGAYYYGSGKYRNSPTCEPGDKAKTVIDFFIDDADTIDYAGGSVYFSMIADGSYSQIKTVYENVDLCSMKSLKVLSGNGCPSRGYYQIQEKFYWDKSSNSNNSTAFYPKIAVGFRSAETQYTYDYGGANTDLCRGSTFVTWTKRVKKSYANALSNFIKTFGILCTTIAMMGAFIWLLTNKPKNLRDAKAKLVPNGHMQNDDNVFDFKKLPTGANRPSVQLVDF